MASATPAGTGLGGGVGLVVLSVVAGIVSAVAGGSRYGVVRVLVEACADFYTDLGSLDDNLTLPIISGGCILGFFKLVGMAASWLTSS